jgi:hypothetical protein
VIAAVQMAMLGGLRCPQVRDAPITHPTMAEGLNLLLDSLEVLRASARRRPRRDLRATSPSVPVAGRPFCQHLRVRLTLIPIKVKATTGGTPLLMAKLSLNRAVGNALTQEPE